jgi:hypothetical protein
VVAVTDPLIPVTEVMDPLLLTAKVPLVLLKLPPCNAPDVLMVSPEVTGDKVVPVLFHHPWLPVVALVVIAPSHVRLPFAPFTVQPVAPAPPARFILVAVLLPGPILSAVVAPPPKLMVVAVALRRLKVV